jgi:hypothetical protein
MTTTPEGRVAAALRQAVIEAGGEIRKLRWEGRNGAPDYFVVLNGKVWLIECKAPGKRPRASQMLEFERLLQAGINVLVIDNAAHARGLVEILTTCGCVAGRRETFCSISDFAFQRYRKKCD